MSNFSALGDLGTMWHWIQVIPSPHSALCFQLLLYSAAGASFVLPSVGGGTEIMCGQVLSRVPSSWEQGCVTTCLSFLNFSCPCQLLVPAAAPVSFLASFPPPHCLAQAETL